MTLNYWKQLKRTGKVWKFLFPFFQTIWHIFRLATYKYVERTEMKGIENFQSFSIAFKHFQSISIFQSWSAPCIQYTKSGLLIRCFSEKVKKRILKESKRFETKQTSHRDVCEWEKVGHWNHPLIKYPHLLWFAISLKIVSCCVQWNFAHKQIFEILKLICTALTFTANKFDWHQSKCKFQTGEMGKIKETPHD